MKFLACGFVQDTLLMEIFSFKLEHEKQPVLIPMLGIHMVNYCSFVTLVVMLHHHALLLAIQLILLVPSTY